MVAMETFWNVLNLSQEICESYCYSEFLNRLPTFINHVFTWINFFWLHRLIQRLEQTGHLQTGHSLAGKRWEFSASTGYAHQPVLRWLPVRVYFIIWFCQNKRRNKYRRWRRNRPILWEKSIHQFYQSPQRSENQCRAVSWILGLAQIVTLVRLKAICFKITGKTRSPVWN